MENHINRIKALKNGRFGFKLLMTLLFQFFVLHGQSNNEYIVRKLTIDDGFSENLGYSILKDSQGFIWKAGFYYLDRYDGYQVKSYLVGDKSKHFVGDRIMDLFQDKSKHLWVITDKGFLRYDRKADIFSHIPFDYSTEAYCVDSDNNIWLAHEGLNQLDQQTNNIKRVLSLPDTILAIADMGEELWLSVQHELLAYNKSTGEKKYFNPLRLSNGRSYKHIYKDPNGLIWVLDSKKLFLLNPDNLQYWEWSFDELPDKDIPCRLRMDMDGNLWIASESGCFIFPLSKDRLVQMKHNPNYPNSIQSNLINSIFIDNHNVVWMTTLQNGIAYIDLNQKPFGRVFRVPYKASTLSGNSIYAITPGQGNSIWIGTENGLDLYNYEEKSFRNIKFPDGQTYWVDFLTTNEQDKVYFATKNSKTLRMYDPESGVLEQYEVPVEDGVIRCILIDKNSIIYVGLILGSKPFYKFDPSNKQFIDLITEDASEHMSGQVFHMIEDAGGLIWLGVKNGCVVYNPYTSSAKFIPIRLEDGSNPGFTPYVHYIYQQKETKNMWFATANGLFLLSDSKQGFFKRYDIMNGLPSNTIENVLEDKQNNLWLGTNSGLSKFNPVNESSKNYSINDGIQGNHFEHFAACVTNDGTLCFGGSNGFDIFTPHQIQDNPFPPNIVLTGLKIIYHPIDLGDTFGGRVVLKSSIEKATEVVLKGSEKAFSIQYAALHYADPERNQYAYYLEGFESTYNVAGSRREATYTNVPPGRYEFHVRASNNDGLWNTTDTTLAITILPPWYSTSYAIIAYLIVLGAFIFFGTRIVSYQNRLKQDIRLEKLSKEKENELTQLKLRFFTNISHEFKTPLTLIIGYVDQANKMLNDLPDIQNKLAKARINSQRLLRLINQLIDFRKSEQDVLKLNRRNEDIIPIVKQVFDSFQSYSEQNNIELNLYTQIDSFPVLIDRDKIENVLYNLISNAIKFNYSQGKVNIRVSYHADDKVLYISVSDTGIGIASNNLEKIFERFYQITPSHKTIPYASIGSGIGLSFSKRLIELHGGTITVESDVGKGSTFTIAIPAISSASLPYESDNASFTDTLSSTMSLAPNNRDYRFSIPDKNAPTILIVEDNTEMREFICSVLWDEYRIEEAENGKAGLDMAIQDNPDLIISDIMMPLLDGISMCKALKTNLTTCHIPIILLSAKTDIESKLQGMELRADDYLEKPFSQEYLKARIQNLLSIRENLRSHFSRPTGEPSGLHKMNALDKAFIEIATKIIEEKMCDPDFSVKMLSDELSLNRVHMYRKFSAITGLLPKDYIKQVRLSKAAQLLKERQLTVAEIGYAVGYSAPSNFNSAFKTYFGKTPKEYQEGS